MHVRYITFCGHIRGNVLWQALRDNADELENLESMRAAGVCDAAGTPWTVDPYFEQSSADSSSGSWGGTGVLHCVDNMAHAHTTAHKVLKVVVGSPVFVHPVELRNA